MNNEEKEVSSSGLPDQETSEPEILEEESEEESEVTSEEESENIEIDTTYPTDRFEGSYAYQTTQLVNDSIDYSGYFENLQTISILILGCLVAIGCVLAWIGAKRE